ncbi:hypothetical protein [Mesobacillus subterraneus]|uniref:Nuclear transport factor 2 family protein n=1 Tax=Mesobacillus subterraneus TaxID=285983 RepID=A0A427TUD9_9BACI|nr:hypothetical protein [Mesobacillus subterraneus]RSD28080.1 hypothetical protein EJA10_06360 [Mesobacillus subterraneus]
MKKVFGIVAIIAGFSLLSAFFVPGLTDRHESKQAAIHVLENLKEQNFERAFNGVHYYDAASDLAPETPFEEAKEIWSKRVHSLKEQGTHLVDYKNLSVELDDTYPVGTVDLVMMINGEEKIIKDVSVWFGHHDGKWGLGNLHYYRENDREEDWEKAFSGNIDRPE